MTNDARPVDEATPAAHKAAKEGNPQQLLEKLPAMLHGVVMFKNPTRQHPRAILHTNAVMRATIPATVDRFQQALDMLEIEILKAKAALHRDLTKFHKAAELARQKELEEEERRLALEREAEAERLRLQKASEEAEESRLAAEAAAAAAAAAEAEAAAVAAAAAAAAAASADLEMALDEPTTAHDDTDMDRLFEDVQDMDSLKVEEDASAPPSAIDASHPLEMSNIPLVAASASKDATGKPDSKKTDAGTNTVTTTDAGVTATFEDPIILDSPLMPAADGDDDAEGPSAVDLFGDDPLNPATENKEGRETAAGGASMSIEEQIDMDFLFAPNGAPGTDGAADGTGAAGTSTDDLFGDLDVGADGGKLDLMNLDIPGLDTTGDGKDGKKLGQAAVQTTADISALPDGSSFDDLLASFGDGALLGQLENDGTSLFDDAFDIYNN